LKRSTIGRKDETVVRGLRKGVVDSRMERGFRSHRRAERQMTRPTAAAKTQPILLVPVCLLSA
jgi:hypothetical protein